MRIIEYGHIKPKTIKCNHCGAILEYVPKDLIRWRNIYYFICPICKGNVVTDKYE